MVASRPSTMAAVRKTYITLSITVVAEKTDIRISQDSGALIKMDAAPQLADLVRMLNGLGATPQDLLAILQAIKAAGAMNAELEVI